MTTIETSVRVTKESARRMRAEPVGSITGTNVQLAIQQASVVAGGTTPPALAATLVNFAASPYTVLPADTLIEVDTTAGAVTIVTPTSSTRNGVGFYVKDVAGNAGTNNINVTTAENIDGLASYPIIDAYGSKFFQPKSGGFAVL